MFHVSLVHLLCMCFSLSFTTDERCWMCIAFIIKQWGTARYIRLFLWPSLLFAPTVHFPIFFLGTTWFSLFVIFQPFRYFVFVLIHVCVSYRLLAHAKVESAKLKEAAEQRRLKRRTWLSFRWFVGCWYLFLGDKSCYPLIVALALCCFWFRFTSCLAETSACSSSRLYLCGNFCQFP